MPEPALLAALRQLAPAGAGCGWADPQIDYPRLAEEDLPGAVPARLREFAAGRAAARAALNEIGCAAVAIPHGADRAPVWPRGIVGSITHSKDQCLAIVIPAASCQGIGIDLEPHEPLPRDLWPTVLSESERGTLAALPLCNQGAAAKALFSAKEAAYKAQYALTRAMLDFQDLQVTLGSGAFRATLQKEVRPLPAQSVLGGRIVTVQGHILTLAQL